MFVTRIKLKNWRNFRSADIALRDRTFLLGANASGKSNFMDAFRFLRDISKPKGGGLQQAIADRLGVSKLRCLHARRDPEVRIEIHCSDNVDDPDPAWRYILGFKPEGKGAQRVLISAEVVFRGTKKLLERPSAEDKKDDERLTQTHLEQIQANAEFRELAVFLGATTYLHLVPQLLKFADYIGGRRLEGDPFGQGFMERIAKTTAKTREARLKRIESALVIAVPQFKHLRYHQDETTGLPHLEALYKHQRPNAGWQQEDQFSDGTLRLLGLLWSLLDGESLLLLEEPELSLNDGIVKEIPRMLQSVQRNSKRRRQIIVSTHSESLLSNPGIDGRGVIFIQPGPEGSVLRQIDDQEKFALRNGLSVAEVVLPKTRPDRVDQLGLWE